MQMPISIYTSLSRLDRPSRTLTDSRNTVGLFLSAVVHYRDASEMVVRTDVAVARDSTT
jgi:hypothetical protein